MLPTLVNTAPTFCGLLAYFGLCRWTSFGWDLPAQEMSSGYEYIRIDPEPPSSLHNEILTAYGSDTAPATANGALPVFCVCEETLGVSMLTIDEDWDNEFQGCNFVSMNFNPRKHSDLSPSDEQKARAKLAAIKEMPGELAKLFLEDDRPKLIPLIDLSSKTLLAMPK